MEPNYQEGDIIYVDPELAATNGKDIVIRLDDRNEVTFKRLVIETLPDALARTQELDVDASQGERRVDAPPG
jgi:phage repressor protein C with HTH and peptisase S24 domain